MAVYRWDGFSEISLPEKYGVCAGFLGNSARALQCDHESHVALSLCRVLMKGNVLGVHTEI